MSLRRMPEILFKASRQPPHCLTSPLKPPYIPGLYRQVGSLICRQFLRHSVRLQDPSVMSAALCALHETIKQDPVPYKNLIPSFISILKQAKP